MPITGYLVVVAMAALIVACAYGAHKNQLAEDAEAAKAKEQK